jgi:hypothetical protein
MKFAGHVAGDRVGHIRRKDRDQRSEVIVRERRVNVNWLPRLPKLKTRLEGLGVPVIAVTISRSIRPLALVRALTFSSPDGRPLMTTSLPCTVNSTTS